MRPCPMGPRLAKYAVSQHRIDTIHIELMEYLVDNIPAGPVRGPPGQPPLAA